MCVFTYMYFIYQSLYRFHVLLPSEAPSWTCHLPFFPCSKLTGQSTEADLFLRGQFSSFGWPFGGTGHCVDTQHACIERFVQPPHPSPNHSLPLAHTPSQSQPASCLRLDRLWNTGMLCVCIVPCRPIPHYEEEEMHAYIIDLLNFEKKDEKDKFWN